jgi:hypothetical protein
MAKEGYKPTAGMKAAAKRAIRWKEQGKATGAGTAVGWTRAGQLARGETLSLSTVKRMYSFFSRHEVLCGTHGVEMLVSLGLAKL